MKSCCDCLLHRYDVRTGRTDELTIWLSSANLEIDEVMSVMNYMSSHMFAECENQEVARLDIFAVVVGCGRHMGFLMICRPWVRFLSRGFGNGVVKPCDWSGVPCSLLKIHF